MSGHPYPTASVDLTIIVVETMQVTSIERHVQFNMTLKPSVALPSSFLLLPLLSYPFLILPIPLLQASDRCTRVR